MKLINIQIDDWSGDGYGQHEDYYFKSNKSIEDVRKAYFIAKDTYPNLCPETFCCDYEDTTVPKQIIKDAKALGFKIDKNNFFNEEMAKHVAWFCKLGDECLELTMRKSPPTLSFYGFDENKRYIGFFDYGLLSNG
jgi:hypothetical protein